MDARQIPEAIQWHEGLLLTPQHFQQFSLRQETLLQYVAASLAPFGWGVRYFKVDQASLVGGMLRVLEIEAVMPDSLVVSCGARRGEELQVDLLPYAEQMKERPVAVYLAVPAHESDALRRGDLARYDSVEGEPVADESTGEGQIRIPRLRPRLSLLVTDAPPAKYITFPLVKVVYRDESFALTDFIPPALSVPRQSPLGVMCSAAAKRLREKAASLADQLRGPAGGGRAGFDMETENLLRSLVTPLPLFEGVLNTGVSHPYLVYLALLSVVGHVSVMGRSPVPPTLLSYDHNDPRPCFEQALDFVTRKVDEGVTSSFTPHTFRYEEGIYSLMFEGGWSQRRLALGLRGQSGMSEQEVVRWGRECLVGSRSRMQWMRETRILGARREPIEHDESFVPPRGVVLFSLKADPEFVEPNEVLQIFNTGERGRGGRPAEIVLYVGNTP
ncbi:MAG: type secretion system protein ImpJ [Acidobacteriota bacterium]|jgi:type VI secretion system protein ImpJ|nr:type secretion system protein ImpJ [Acidobacteriota bacterium]